MKLNRQYLIESILEVISESDSQMYFDHIMNLINNSYEDALGGIELYKSLSTPDDETGEAEVNFTPEEKQAIEQRWIKVQGDNIIRSSEEPDQELIDLGFDWHNEFYGVYGFRPPEDIKFKVVKDEVKGRIIVVKTSPLRKNEIEFSFWLADSNPDYPSDPWVYLKSVDKDNRVEHIFIDHDVSDDNIQPTVHITADYGDGGMIGGPEKKEDIPGIIREAMGWDPQEEPSEWPGLPKVSGTLSETEKSNDPISLQKAKVDDMMSDIVHFIEFGADWFLNRAMDIARQSNPGPSKEDVGTNLRSIKKGETNMAHQFVERILKRYFFLEKIVRAQKGAVWTRQTGVEWPEIDVFGELRGLSQVEIRNYILVHPEIQELGNDLHDKFEFVYDVWINPEEFDEYLLGIAKSVGGGWKQAYELHQSMQSESQIEENFGATAEAEVLEEAWDSQWPKFLSGISKEIDEYTEKKDKAVKEILAKYALEAFTFNNLNPGSIYSAYTRLLKAFMRTYLRDGDDLSKARRFINKVLDNNSIQNMMDHFRDVRSDKGAEGALRFINNTIKSLNKQFNNLWGSMDGEGLDFESVANEFNEETSKGLQKQQFREINYATSRILDIIKFVNADKKDDNAKKLTAFYKNIKQAAASPEIDVSAIADEVNIIQLSVEFARDQMLNINMVDCDDYLSVSPNMPCILHKFDDGFFWYDIKSDSCDISARKMNNCGEASMSGSELYNLMSYSETGKPNWHVMIEWNPGEKAIIQVLGNSNSVPKQEYWPYIKWFYEKWGKPEISNYAWEHVRGDNVKQRVYGFLQYLGLKSQQPLSETWEQMKQQVSDGFYNVFSWGEGERPVEDDWSKLSWIPHADRVAMAMRIKRRLISTKSIETGQFEYEDVRDYKAAAKKLENEGIVGKLLFQDMIPEEWTEFFKSTEGITQRVRFSHNGNMVLYFNWTTKKLQDPSDGNYRDEEYMKQLQREMLARFMNETKRNFNVEAMTGVGRLVAKYLEKDADGLGHEESSIQ